MVRYLWSKNGFRSLYDPNIFLQTFSKVLKDAQHFIQEILLPALTRFIHTHPFCCTLTWQGYNIDILIEYLLDSIRKRVNLSAHVQYFHWECLWKSLSRLLNISCVLSFGTPGGPGQSLSPPVISEVCLTAGMPFLLELSHHLATPVLCRSLATHLLESYPCGGMAFIESRQSYGAPLNWKLMAHDVLREWCRIQPRQATTVNLLQVLRSKMHANSAADVVVQHFR